jgi:hypothetical protein
MKPVIQGRLPAARGGIVRGHLEIREYNLAQNGKTKR